MLRWIEGLVACAVMLCVAAPADARWLRAESDHFIVYGDNGERQVRQAAEDLETYHAMLTQLLQPEGQDGAKLEVYLFRQRRDLNAVWPTAPDWVGGFYDSSPEYVGAVALQQTSMGEFRSEVLLHEYAHHFMLQYYANAYPAWFGEGFAGFVQTAEIRQRRVRVGIPPAGTAQALVNRPFPPIEDVLKPNPQRPIETSAFYGVSWLMTHYVMNNPERLAGLGRYLNAMQQGEDAIEAFEPAFGISTAQFQQELRAYLRSDIRGFVLPGVERDEPVITVSAMPASASQLLPLVVQARRGIYLATEEEIQSASATLAASIEREAAPFGGDVFAQRALARAKLLRGDAPGARAVLEPIIAANADDIDAQFLMGMTYMHEARAGEIENFVATATPARRHFARVARLDPKHVAMLYYYAETFAYTPGPMSEDSLDVLTQAHLLAPQVMQIRVHLAQELMEARRFEEAAGVLEPAAFMPHENPLSRHARVLLNAARENRFPTPEDWSGAGGAPAAE